MTMSPTGDFLATAHVNYLGLFLWANKTLFSHVSLRAINPDTEPPLLDLPTSMASNVTDEDLKDALDALSMDGGEELDPTYTSPIQLNIALVTMSQLTAARWQNLLDIDLVKKRNRPKAPPTVPKQAPFFLPTVAGLDLKFDMTLAEQEAAATAANSKLLIPQNFQNLTAFGKCLDDSVRSGTFGVCMDHLMSLGPSMVDFEIKSLQADGSDAGGVRLMVQFLRMIVEMLESNLNFELAQIYLGVFLKAHGRAVVEQRKLREIIPAIEEAQRKSWQALEDKLIYGLGVVAALRNFSN